jgi:hypothetical protein
MSENDDSKLSDSLRPGESYRSKPSEVEEVSGKKGNDSHILNDSIEFVRKYLKYAEPPTILIHAALIYVLARVFGFIAYKAAESNITSGDSNDSAVFIGGIASLAMTCAMVLAVWAIARLIADAIQEGHTDD